MMTKQKGYEYQGIWAIEAFEDENTRIDVECYNYYENKDYVRLQGYWEPKGQFQIKLTLLLMFLPMNQKFNVMFKL